MSYSKEFKIVVATIYGEADASSVRSWEVIAHSMRNRIGFGNWTQYSTIYGIATTTGYDAYTSKNIPYYEAMSQFNSGNISSLLKKVIDTVLPIYEGKVKDDTNGVVSYWSPEAQKQLHRDKPKLYTTAVPDWVKDNKKEIVKIAGTEKDDFQWLRFKRSKMFVTLRDNKGLPMDGVSVDIRFASGKKVPVLSNLKTNSKGQLPVFFARIEMGARFIVDGNYIKDKKGNNLKILPTGKDIVATIIVGTGNGFKSSLEKHETESENTQVRNDTVGINNTPKTNTASNLEEVTFNIKLVEGDTGKPLPNTPYYFEYKNNIKPHKTDSSGIESGIKADVSQSIGVYLDDDGGKKKSIYSMAFPVTGDLNGQTKVLKVPVVTLQLKFVDKSKKPIPNYQFKTVYRGRTSETKKANARGLATVKALAGQELKIIHVVANKFTRNIVTDGSTEWTFDTSKLIKDSSSSASSASNASFNNPSSAQKPNDTKPNTSSPVDKSNVIRNDKITQEGPTHEVKTDQAKITIKFLDEATDKPLSGLTYWTQSTKYGKNPATTGSDGTRGHTHDSDVGISIAVLVNENGKEVKKGTIVANSDKNGVAYVYKAKKPKHSNIKISFSRNTKSTVVTEKTKTILREIAEKYGAKELIITSSLRTPEEQASAMYDNIAGGKRISYRTPGEIVTQVCEKGIKMKLGREKTIQNMVSKILEYDKKGQRVSKHCVSFETYAKANIIDLGINSNGFNTYTKKERFQRICDEAERQGKISGFISPLRDKAEPAFHLEIPQ
ncbi:hypothetical protein ACT3TH_01345 [Psychrobacter sp. AOP22-C1-C5]|uniref:hypothetical protein n=1 Tax=Psychrobacter sp. AOP22-C1-C5 TaxID=3457716 RepID=UPI00403556BE